MPIYAPLTNVHLTGLARDLKLRADTGKPIRVGVIGSGEMGTDLVTQGMLMRGIEITAIATRRPHTALDATAIAYGDTSHAVEADTEQGHRRHRSRQARDHLRRHPRPQPAGSTSSSMPPASPASPPTSTCWRWSTASIW